jgi:hypothetical protein
MTLSLALPLSRGSPRFPYFTSPVTVNQLTGRVFLGIMSVVYSLEGTHPDQCASALPFFTLPIGFWVILTMQSDDARGLLFLLVDTSATKFSLSMDHTSGHFLSMVNLPSVTVDLVLFPLDGILAAVTSSGSLLTFLYVVNPTGGTTSSLSLTPNIIALAADTVLRRLYVISTSGQLEALQYQSPGSSTSPVAPQSLYLVTLGTVVLPSYVAANEYNGCVYVAGQDATNAYVLQQVC